MTNEQAIEIIRKEYKCVDQDCDIERSCGKCELSMPNKGPILQAYKMAIQALSQEPKILDTIDFAIDASNGDTNYFVGFRNGLRYAKSLIDGEEPQFESCAKQEPMREFTEEEAKAYSKALDKMYKPTGFNVFNEPCEDVISRQAVRHILNHEVKIPIKVWKKLFELVDCLPPVNPKTICEEREKGECPYYAG